jgi:hypothetical protein
VFAFQQVDVFSSKPLLGNPLAVVIGADAFSDERMAAFAKWPGWAAADISKKFLQYLLKRVRVVPPLS